MAGLLSVYVGYADNQLTLYNPQNEDIDLDIVDNQLIYTSSVYTDAEVIDDQLYVEASVPGLIFEIVDKQLYFYNVYDDDIDFTLEDGQLIMTSHHTYSDGFIRSNQCFVEYGITLDTDEITTEIATNIHQAFLNAQRCTFGYVQVVYYNPLLENTNMCTATSESADSQLQNIFKDDKSGWISGGHSDAGGYINETLYITCSPRILGSLDIIFNEEDNTFAKELNITISNGTQEIQQNVFNLSDTYLTILLSEVLTNVTTIQINITRLNKADVPVIITYVNLQYMFDYMTNDLMGVDLLEELTYSDNDAQLGAISANETVIYFNNETHAFDFNNTGSRISSQLKKNRKILPYLGISAQNPETGFDMIYWIPCGVFWSHNWIVEQNSPIAQVTGFDTLGLFNNIECNKQYVLRDVTIYQILEVILQQMQDILYDLTYWIDPNLNSDVIPFVAFERTSYFNVLQTISACYPIDIYCDRKLRIICRSQLTSVTSDIVTWQDSDIIKSTKYPTLYTDVYNVVTVNVYKVIEVSNDILLEVSDELKIDTSLIQYYTFSNICTNTPDNPVSINIEADDTVTIESKEWYSWGVIITYSGTGYVHSVNVIGDSATLRAVAFAQCRDEESITEAGTNELIIDSNLIQNSGYAHNLANTILNKLNNARYYAEVENRGDFLLTLNDHLYLPDSIVPNKNYRIKEQSLYWDGALSGNTKLYTDNN